MAAPVLVPVVVWLLKVVFGISIAGGAAYGLWTAAQAAVASVLNPAVFVSCGVAAALYAYYWYKKHKKNQKLHAGIDKLQEKIDRAIKNDPKIAKKVKQADEQIKKQMRAKGQKSPTPVRAKHAKQAMNKKNAKIYKDAKTHTR